MFVSMGIYTIFHHTSSLDLYLHINGIVCVPDHNCSVCFIRFAFQIVTVINVPMKTIYFLLHCSLFCAFAGILWPMFQHRTHFLPGSTNTFVMYLA